MDRMFTKVKRLPGRSFENSSSIGRLYRSVGLIFFALVAPMKGGGLNHGTFISQRSHPSLALIETGVSAG